MRFRFSPWLLVIGLILICGLAVGILMYFRRAVAVTPQAMVSYLPQGEQTVVYVDVNALRQSKMRRFFLRHEQEPYAAMVQRG